MSVSLHEISIGQILGAPGPVTSTVSATTSDTDDTLHIDQFSDPGWDQVFHIAGADIAGAQVAFRVSVTYTPVGSDTPVTLSGAIVVLTIDRVAYYYLLSDAGSGFPCLDAGIDVTIGDRVVYAEGIRCDEIACFAAGTLISTPVGPSPVNALRRGDLVLTADHGPQPVFKIGGADLGPEALALRPEFRRVRLRAGCFGPGLPARDLLLSPQHRLLLSGWRVQL